MPRATGCVLANHRGRYLARMKRENRLLDALDPLSEMIEARIDLLDDDEVDWLTSMLEAVVSVAAVQRALLDYRRISRDGESRESWEARNTLRYGQRSELTDLLSDNWGDYIG